MSARNSQAPSSGVTSPLDQREPSPNRRGSRPPNTRNPSTTAANHTRRTSSSRPPSTSLNTRRAARTQQSPSRQPLGIHTNSGNRSRRPSETNSIASSRSQSQSRPPVAETRRDGPNRWPVSPRIRSPITGPSAEQQSRRYASSVTSNSTVELSESETDDTATPSGLRTPTMNSVNRTAGLDGTTGADTAMATDASQGEPVEPIGLPGIPSQQTSVAMARINDRLRNEPSRQSLYPNTTDAESSASASDPRSIRARNMAPYNESDAAQTGDNRRLTAATVQPPMMSRQSSSFSTITKSKPSDGSAMIVESETVTSVAHLVPQPGTLRTQPSTETIRPRKERKGRPKKQSATPGAASSRAEIFEHQVGRAVDENEASDSDETFVYDSSTNHDQPRRYHHSRTPSTASMHSQADRPHRSVNDNTSQQQPQKRNMKFANTYNSADAHTGDEEGRGSGRSNPGSSRGTTRHHSRFGRHSGTAPGSLFDNESPFSGGARGKLQISSSRQTSGPPSPRYMTSRMQPTRTKGNLYSMTSSYDLDDNVPNERTPLVYTNATGRHMRQSRRGMSQRHLEAQAYHRAPSALNRLAACLVMTMMVLLIITGAIGFMFATTQPLTDIELVSIDNVLASEPELMLDATLRAHNPNIVVVTVEEASLEIFAKSIHAGTDLDWEPKDPINIPPSVDDGVQTGDLKIRDDPDISPPDEAAPNFRLGTVTHFDSPLSFEGLFFHRGLSLSTAAMRLPLPGNGTTGGSARWTRIIQDDFDLIVKGTIKYYLPLSRKIRNASVSGRVRVHSNSATKELDSK